MAARYTILLLTIILTLTSLTSSPAGEAVIIAPPKAAELIDALGCRGCHLLDRRGGSLGPILDKVGNRLDPARLRLKLLWPQSLSAGTAMPSYEHLPPEQITLLVDFLQRQK